MIKLTKIYCRRITDSLFINRKGALYLQTAIKITAIGKKKSTIFHASIEV